MPAKQISASHFGKHLREVVKKAPRVIGVLGVNHFKESFKIQRFNDYGSQPWPKATSHNRKNVLVGKQSGALRNSIQVERADLQEIKWIAKRPYAHIHNEGGTVKVPVTKKMRKFAWAMYYKEGGKGIKTGKDGGAYQSISVGKKANKWRGLALTKKTHLTITIKQRKYMGRSKAFEHTINDWFTENLNYR